MDFVADHWLLLGGCLAFALALAAWHGDRRRSRRRDPDRVGLMPWLSLAFWASAAALLLLGGALLQWLGAG